MLGPAVQCVLRWLFQQRRLPFTQLAHIHAQSQLTPSPGNEPDWSAVGVNSWAVAFLTSFDCVSVCEIPCEGFPVDGRQMLCSWIGRHREWVVLKPYEEQSTDMLVLVQRQGEAVCRDPIGREVFSLASAPRLRHDFSSTRWLNYVKRPIAKMPPYNLRDPFEDILIHVMLGESLKIFPVGFLD